MLAVRHEVRRAFLPVVGVGNALFIGAVGANAPQVLPAIDVAAKGDPLAGRRNNHFRLIPLVVGQPAPVAAIDIGNVEFTARGVFVLIRPVPHRQMQIVPG